MINQKNKLSLRRLGLIPLVGILSACAFWPVPSANVKLIYEEAAQYHQPDRNPIIVIPGILGSRLIDEESGDVVWGAFEAPYANPNSPRGARLVSLPFDEDGLLNADSSTIQPNGVLERLRLSLLGVPINIQAYAGILSSLGAGGYRDESLSTVIDYGSDHFTCFQFDYDWRRSSAENAARLKEFIEERRAYVREEYYRRYGIDNEDIKFDIVAHSMGGLVSRYFARYGDQALPEDGSLPELTWEGAEYVERIIMVGTPNAGALESFEQLIDGFNVGGPLIPKYGAHILGTFPSIYELLPRPRHKRIIWEGDNKTPIDNLYDPQLWESYEWGLAAQDKATQKFLETRLPHIKSAEERHQVAKNLQRDLLENSAAFHRALDYPATPPEGFDLILVAGDAIKTPSEITINRETGDVDISDYGPGDKTVLRASALFDERVGAEWQPNLQSPIAWDNILFLSSNHRNITQDPAFTDNVLYWLLEDPR